MKKLIFTLMLVLVPSLSWAVYDLPDGTCPSNCRKITWSAGLDAEGGIPDVITDKYASAYGASPDNGTNDHTQIQNCLDAVTPPGACELEAGTYRIAGDIQLPSGVVLRGQGGAYGSTITTLYIVSASGNGYGERIQLGTTKPTFGSEKSVTNEPSKNDTTLTLANVTGLAVNDYVSIFEDRDTGIPVSPTSNCSWCGEDNSNGHFMQQYSQITAINSNTITISPGLYYDFDGSFSPGVKEATFTVDHVGLEDLKIDNSNIDAGVVSIEGARHSWVKKVETYQAGSNSGEVHFRIMWSYGVEIRDSYINEGKSASHNSGSNYGIFVIYWNSAHKFENNVFRDLRHGVNFEGGGSGTAILYNYFNDHYESEDQTFLDADLNPNHGPHPFMNLLEGNSSAKIVWDDTFGTSSHSTAFRNWARGERSTPSFSWGQWAVDVQAEQHYMSLVGNVLGDSTWTSGTIKADGNCSPTEPTAMKFGCDGQPGSYTDSSAQSTALIHGNYDYVGDAVNEWGGGADHTLKDSMYYGTVQQDWMEDKTAPFYGPDVSGYVTSSPAEIRYNGGTYNYNTTFYQGNGYSGSGAPATKNLGTFGCGGNFQ